MLGNGEACALNHPPLFAFLMLVGCVIRLTMPIPPADPVILLDPYPRKIERIFDEATKRRLEKFGRVLWHDGSPASAEHIDGHLPRTIALIGQSAMDQARLDRAPHLRAIFNVESNF